MPHSSRRQRWRQQATEETHTQAHCAEKTLTHTMKQDVSAHVVDAKWRFYTIAKLMGTNINSSRHVRICHSVNSFRWMPNTHQHTTTDTPHKLESRCVSPSTTQRSSNVDPFQWDYFLVKQTNALNVVHSCKHIMHTNIHHTSLLYLWANGLFSRIYDAMRRTSSSFHNLAASETLVAQKTFTAAHSIVPHTTTKCVYVVDVEFRLVLEQIRNRTRWFAAVALSWLHEWITCCNDTPCSRSQADKLRWQ